MKIVSKTITDKIREILDSYSRSGSDYMDIKYITLSPKELVQYLNELSFDWYTEDSVKAIQELPYFYYHVKSQNGHRLCFRFEVRLEIKDE